MEHKLIQGGEEYLPFARSCIRALKASGQTYATQRITMPDGAMVSVRLAGEQEYIEINGSTGNLYLVFWEPASFDFIASNLTLLRSGCRAHKRKSALARAGKFHIVKTTTPDCKVFKVDRVLRSTGDSFEYTRYEILSMVAGKPVMNKDVRANSTVTKTRFLGKDGESSGSFFYADWDIAAGLSESTASQVPSGKVAGKAAINLVNARLPALGLGAAQAKSAPFVREEIDFGFNTIQVICPDANNLAETNVVRACGSASFLAGTLDADFKEVLNVVRYNGSIRIRTLEAEFAEHGDFPESNYAAYRFFDDHIVTVRGGDITAPGAFSISCFNINDKSHKTVKKKVFENLIPQGCYLVGVHRDEVSTMAPYLPTP